MRVEVFKALKHSKDATPRALCWPGVLPRGGEHYLGCAGENELEQA